MKKNSENIKERLTDRDRDRIVEMAWEDRTPFEAIASQFQWSEQQVIEHMRRELRASSFRRWRKRVNSGKSSKHLRKRSPQMNRFKCSRQRMISSNRLSKR